MRACQAWGYGRLVRCAERRMAVGLVEAEDIRPGNAHSRLNLEQLVELGDHAVDVGAEVGVHVVRLEPGWHLAQQVERVRVE